MAETASGDAPIRLALVGIGKIARDHHVPAIAALIAGGHFVPAVAFDS